MGFGSRTARFHAAGVFPVDRRALRPFLQACFVWYGLANFWSQAHGSKGFADTREVRGWLERTLSGFTKGPLLQHIREFEDVLSREVRDGIAEMQDTILSAVRAVA